MTKTQLYTREEMIKMLDIEPVNKGIANFGYSKEEFICDYGEDCYKSNIINYYLTDNTISSVVENGKNCKLSYYFIEK